MWAVLASPCRGGIGAAEAEVGSLLGNRCGGFCIFCSCCGACFDGYCQDLCLCRNPSFSGDLLQPLDLHVRFVVDLGEPFAQTFQ
ncbi:hypothetical protein [Mycobacterium marinum]|uniref:hypothetical protein n=1 Tax=Mycobacterium marinum TaxID=1781 RepID=UPI0035637FB1